MNGLDVTEQAAVPSVGFAAKVTFVFRLFSVNGLVVTRKAVLPCKTFTALSALVRLRFRVR